MLSFVYAFKQPVCIALITIAVLSHTDLTLIALRLCPQSVLLTASQPCLGNDLLCRPLSSWSLCFGLTCVSCAGSSPPAHSQQSLPYLEAILFAALVFWHHAMDCCCTLCLWFCLGTVPDDLLACLWALLPSSAQIPVSLGSHFGFPHLSAQMSTLYKPI